MLLRYSRRIFDHHQYVDPLNGMEQCHVAEFRRIGHGPQGAECYRWSINLSINRPLIHWLSDWLIVWLIDYLIDWLIVWWSDLFWSYSAESQFTLTPMVKFFFLFTVMVIKCIFCTVWSPIWLSDDLYCMIASTGHDSMRSWLITVHSAVENFFFKIQPVKKAGSMRRTWQISEKKKFDKKMSQKRHWPTNSRIDTAPSAFDMIPAVTALGCTVRCQQKAEVSTRCFVYADHTSSDPSKKQSADQGIRPCHCE